MAVETPMEPRQVNQQKKDRNPSLQSSYKHRQAYEQQPSTLTTQEHTKQPQPN